jgi:predicted nucleic acid-binding protein
VMPLIFREAASAEVVDLLRNDGDVAVWWGTWTECAVAISRVRRETGFDDEAEEEARARLDSLAGSWFEVEPTDGLRLLAMLISRDYHLKAADCLQLAAALRWCEGDAGDREFVCLDERLRRAASEEGFDTLPELPEAR